MASSVPPPTGCKHGPVLRGRNPAGTAAGRLESTARRRQPRDRRRPNEARGERTPAPAAEGTAAPRPAPPRPRPANRPRAAARRASSGTAPPTASPTPSRRPVAFYQYELPAAVADLQLRGAASPSTPRSMEPSHWLWATEKAGRVERGGPRPRFPAASTGMLGAAIRARDARWELKSFSDTVVLLLLRPGHDGFWEL